MVYNLITLIFLIIFFSAIRRRGKNQQEEGPAEGQETKQEQKSKARARPALAKKKEGAKNKKIKTTKQDLGNIQIKNRAKERPKPKFDQQGHIASKGLVLVSRDLEGPQTQSQAKMATGNWSAVPFYQEAGQKKIKPSGRDLILAYELMAGPKSRRRPGRPR